MRLTKLKIAGFKSFVDPTTVMFPGQLAGVVGPNGCGKSNIIDAVRWVLGESKASELRGESIQDVIFKGSGQRKEVSRASVEMFFDNSLGRAAGQWGQYAEITVKRVLDREGNSNYYINNLHVRRRDMIDLFLGTGLGPRAYAIIGQGMISRIVEAKPDELRFFLEEAAGVTKYKERRKETNHRLEDARENIARVEDIRNELEIQVTRLQAQAAVARHYRQLHEQITRKQAVLWLKKRNDARQESQRLAAQVNETVNVVESGVAELRELEARIEEARELHFSASDVVHAAQTALFEANTEVGRLEAEIGHLNQSRQRLQTRTAQLDAENAHWQQQHRQLELDRERWSDLLESSHHRLDTAQARHEEAAERLPDCEDAVQQAQRALVEVRRAQHETEQALRLAEADAQHARRALDGVTQRRARLEQDRQALGAPDPVLLAQAQENEIRAEEALAQAQERLHALQISAPAAEAELRRARDAMQSAHRRLTETRARHQALQQLQAKVAQQGEIGDWLKAHQLAHAMPLWRSIQVEAGWETAVEAVLRERFAALAAPVGVLRTALTHAPPSILTLALADRAAANTATSADPRALRHKVACSDPLWSAALDAWLRDVYAVDDLYESLLHELPHGGLSYVARSGHLLTAVGLTLYVPDAKTHGVIERQREIDELALRLAAEEEAEDQAREHLHQCEKHLNEQQSQLAAARRNAQQAQQSSHSAQVEALKLTQAQARFEERSTQIDRDQDELRRQEDSETTRREQAELQIEIQRERLGETRLRMDQATHAQRIKEDALREARSQESRLAREAQEAAFSERECGSKLEDTTRAAATATQQLERIRSELASIRSELAGIDDHLLQGRLHEALDRKQARESALAGRRNDLESAASALRAQDEQRLTLELRVAPLRERINELKLKAQAAQLAVEQHQERLTELHIVTVDDEAEFATDLASPLKDNQLQGEIARLNRDIDALGPVNLAALDELTAATERKGFLDEQSNDLNQAIATLEDAIRRIDRETREQLQTTYDTVNSHFGALFPQLFGGGEARLILTGDEILDAGIQIMAQPPGKKNSTIHLLSGGEKALTAIALVFALFQLNPAPFCMLDEVDAPLDDSNTVRFCTMVKRMSTNTQFIFISHSKITMEMAQQLIGVTMQEQGVSRVVEVDIDEAMRMADSSREAA